jgi:hypothetical protein
MTIQWDKAYKGCVLTKAQVRAGIRSRLGSAHSALKREKAKKMEEENSKNKAAATNT